MNLLHMATHRDGPKCKFRPWTQGGEGGWRDAKMFATAVVSEHIPVLTGTFHGMHHTCARTLARK